jgi:hypothetical protein
MEGGTTVIEFGTALDFLAFEKIISQRARELTILEYDQYVFDCSYLQWAGIFQLSILYGWLRELRSQNKRVEIRPPRLGTEASNFLSSTSFLAELQSIGCDVPISQGSRPDRLGLTTFKTFDSRGSLAAYEEALGDPQRITALLGGAADTPLVREGVFRTVLVHELCENAFIHGNGEAVRYAVSMHSRSSARKPHKVLASFDGAPYLEIVVSDDGPGLIERLRPQVPTDYRSSLRLRRETISRDVLTAAYAFEFFSTRDLEGRKDRISEFLQAENLLFEAIATGLWYVASLARQYGGQIIVRTGRVLLNLDFSRDPIGVVNGQANLGILVGTHILVRVPRESGVIVPAMERYVPKRTIGAPPLLKHVPAILEGATPSERDPAAFVLHGEREIHRAIALAADQDLDVVVVLCDGLTADHKAFSVLLANVAVAPRRGRALLIAGLRTELVDAAKWQWSRIQELRITRSGSTPHLYGYQSLLLLPEDLSEIAFFGDTGLPESTRLVDACSGDRLGIRRDEVRALYDAALRSALRAALTSSPIQHPAGFYYLIENRYYTTEFYEVRRLLTMQHIRPLLVSYLRSLVAKISVAVVYCISEPLIDLIGEMGNLVPSVRWVMRTSLHDVMQFAEVLSSVGSNARLLLLADVVCTAENLLRYTQRVHNLDSLVVGCFVDGRKDEVDYLTVRRTDRAYSIPVNAIHRCAIDAIKDPPGRIDSAKILVVDRVTHAPTAYDSVKQQPMLVPEQLIELAHSCGAFVAGHIGFSGKHFTLLLLLRRLVEALQSQIVSWWQAKLPSVMLPSDIQGDLVVLYVDENRGWEKLVPDFFSTKPGTRTEGITLGQLDAPPYPDEHTAERAREVWLILGAMAHGDTAARALEYMTRRFKTSRISVFVILARMDIAKLSFWQRLTSYSDLQVHFDFFSYLPLDAFESTTSCPICNLLVRVQRAQWLTQGYATLSAIVEQRVGSFELRDVSGEVDSGSWLAGQNPVVRNREIVRSLYQDGLRNITRRKELDAYVSQFGNATLLQVFAQDAFASHTAARERTEGIQRVLYQRHEALKQEAQELFDGTATRDSSLEELLGILALYPDYVANRVAVALKKAIENGKREVAENVVFVALLEPEVGNGLVHEAREITSSLPWAELLLSEIRSYPSWSKASQAIDAYLQLIWLLKRSTAWGDKLNALGVTIRVGEASIEQIEKAYSSLESDGLERVLTLVNRLKVIDDSGSGTVLWSAIAVEEPHLDKTFSQVLHARDELRSVLAQSHGGLIRWNELSEAVSNIQTQGRSLCRHLEGIFTNPVDVEMAVNALIEDTRRANNLRVIWERDPACPGILVGLEDLKNMLFAVLDNATQCLTELENKVNEDYWLKIAFSAGMERVAEMTVQDNLPWQEPIRPSGGLKQFVDYCRKYGALHQFNPESIDNQLRIRVLFRIRDTKERYAPC